VYILLLSAIVSAILGKWVDAAVIFSVVIINALIGFVQELKANNAINALSKYLETNTIVLRKKTNSYHFISSRRYCFFNLGG
jgi:Ca2+-transporting ATPase